MKYKDIIAKTKEQIVQEEVDFLVENANITIQQDILKCKKELHLAKITLQSSKENSNFNTEAIYKAYNELKLLERKFEFLDSLQKELF